MTVVELCVEDARDVKISKELGADRVELCRDLECGGLTPTDAEILTAIADSPRLGVQILIRQHPGSFVFRPGEIDDITETIARLVDLTKDSKIPVGMVVGGIIETHELDLEALASWREAAQDRELTFHRAFDELTDLELGLSQLISAGFDRVLTTGGGHGKADLKTLANLVALGEGQITILGSGGLRANNVAQAIKEANLTEVHMRAPSSTEPTRLDLDLARKILHEVSSVN